MRGRRRGHAGFLGLTQRAQRHRVFFRTQRRAGARREDTEGEKKGEGNEQLIKNEE